MFSPFMTNAAHLARYRLADLFLDTAPYGAHTTASDALWMGVPVVTVAGRGFPARVCASLVHNAGLPGLVCSDHAAYRDLAINLARDAARWEAARTRLAQARASCALFDTAGLVRALEDLFDLIWQNYAAGRLPRPNLTNLPLYHEIARTLARDETGAADDDAYRTLLATHDAVTLIPADGRLWLAKPDGPLA